MVLLVMTPGKQVNPRTLLGEPEPAFSLPALYLSCISHVAFMINLWVPFNILVPTLLAIINPYNSRLFTEQTWSGLQFSFFSDL